MATIKVKKFATNDTPPSNLAHGEIGVTQNLLWYGNSAGSNVRIARFSDIPTNNNQLTNGAGYVTLTQITNHSISPKFGTSIGMGNDSAVLYFNDSTNETRTGYWTSKDGFEVRGDGNSMDAVVLKSGNLQINTNAHIGNKVSAKEHIIQSDTGTDSATMKYDSTSKSVKFIFA